MKTACYDFGSVVYCFGLNAGAIGFNNKNNRLNKIVLKYITRYFNLPHWIMIKTVRENESTINNSTAFVVICDKNKI